MSLFEKYKAQIILIVPLVILSYFRHLCELCFIVALIISFILSKYFCEKQIER